MFLQPGATYKVKNNIPGKSNNERKAFHAAVNFTSNAEGGYSDHPDDKGGETVFGIARNYNPQWSGWAIIDELGQKYGKHSQEFISQVENNQKLYESALKLYYSRYWLTVRADELPPEVGIFLYDSAVNHGPKRAIKFLQKATSSVVDGIIGPNTINNTKHFYRINKKQLIHDLIMERWSFFKKIVERDPSQNAFINGWRNRCEALAEYLIDDRIILP